MNIERIPLAQFRLAPTHEVRTHESICVMVHKREAFYAITPKQMEYLLQCESMLDDDKKMDAYDSIFWKKTGDK